MTKEFPAFEYHFQLDVMGTQTKERYLGDFTYVRPNLKNMSNIAKFKTRLDDDLANLDRTIAMLHMMVSQLRFGLTEFPKWWEESDFGLDMYDMNVVAEIYKLCMEFEAQFEEKVGREKKAKKDKEKVLHDDASAA